MHRDAIERIAVLKRALRARQPTLGCWVNIAHPVIVEVLATAGFQWLVIDLEHTTTGLREAAELIRVIEAEKMVPLVRLTYNDPNQIKRLMDAGAGGVIVPMVGSAAEAAQAVSAVRYPPLGTRGIGLSRAQGYGTAFGEYLEHNNRDSIVIVQIEHINAINGLEDILAVEGVDASFIGPYDLSGSMGKPGQLEDDDVKAALARYEEVSARKGMAMGYHVVDPDPAKALEKIAKGYSFVAFGIDFTFLGASCRARMNEVRAGMARN